MYQDRRYHAHDGPMPQIRRSARCRGDELVVLREPERVRAEYWFEMARERQRWIEGDVEQEHRRGRRRYRGHRWTGDFLPRW